MSVRTGKIGQYELLGELGSGGMAVVYLARQVQLDRLVALKELRALDSPDRTFARRFLEESRVAGSLSHPNIVTVHDFFEHEGTPYIAMEYLPRGSLRPFVGQLTLAQIGGVLEGLLAGLAHAESRGIVHRDLKPENLMLRGDGTLVLADFGIAKQLSTALTKTRHGEVYGTPFYMSPEQAHGLPVDGRSDLYSLGVIFHEMLTGAKPFTAARADALVYQHLHADIPILPGRFWRVQPIMDRLLAKDREERFASAVELLAALRDLGDMVEREEGTDPKAEAPA